MNAFVDYLNSANNAGGDTTGSLAETQVKSEYYDKIKVDRTLGIYISETLEQKRYEAFVLTGHAGDGKTSILVQVLKERKRLAPQEGLKKIGEYEDFYYVKDMSEIPSDQQAAVLKQALNAPSQGKSSLLISNTGPLLKAFTELVRMERKAKGLPFSDEDLIQLKARLLNQLDKNLDAPLEEEGFRFTLVNIARMDNVQFATRILRSILDEDLWHPCQACPAASDCPIHKNRCYVHQNFKRVSAFIDNYYRYLYEIDKRMTIRQMVGQLSFALTGNLTCERVKGGTLKTPFFTYDFANQFFGYKGMKPNVDAAQIRGIRQIQSLELDKIALDVDYELFVQRDYFAFSPSIRNILSGLYGRFKTHYQQAGSSDQASANIRRHEAGFRSAVRRFYLMYSAYEQEEELEGVFNQVFGSNYMDYKRLISQEQSRGVKRQARELIFRALYVKNTGFMPTNQVGNLPLTLRREDGVFQNVMLVLGDVEKGNMEVEQEPVVSRFADETGKYRLVLRIKSTTFPITLPLFTYFNSLISGRIATDDNPALSHGIATLDALLLDTNGYPTLESREDCEIKMIINTANGQRIQSLGFIGDRLYVE